MDIIVCIKQVPTVDEVKIDPHKGTLIREGVPSRINPNDENALEEALLLKEKHGGKITAISMGPPQAEDALREALALGVDRAVLLSDRAFGGADTVATSYTLGNAIKKLGQFDLIICGVETSDGSTGQVGPQLAEYLDLPQVSYVRRLEIHDRTLRIERTLEDSYEIVEVELPALVTVTRNINSPRKASVVALIEACREREVVCLSAEELRVDKDAVGFLGSLTQMLRSYVVEPKGRGCEILEGSAEVTAQALVQRLREKNLI